MRIYQFKKNQSFNTNTGGAGFTLIEILVASAIIITATTVVVAILTASFRSITKATISEEVRQNGNSAVTRMSRILQFADSFAGASVDGSNYDPNCTSPGVYKYIRVVSGGATRTLSCVDLSIGSSPLIDPNKVSIDSCNFTCSQDNGTVPPVIGISFNLSQKTSSASEKKASISFTTSVRMRNL